MSDKFKYGDVKNCCFFNDIINIKNWDPNNIKIDLVYKNVFFLRHWLCDDQRFKIRKN